MRRACSSALALLALALPWLLASAAEADSSPRLTLLDARTGIGLSGEVTIAPLEASIQPEADALESLLASSDGSRNLFVATQVSLPIAGAHALVARVEGYRPLFTVLRPADEAAGWTLLLDPVEAGQSSTSASPPNRLVIDGWVHDRSDFRPVADVRIAVEGRPASAVSDSDGRFELDIPAPPQRDGYPEPLAVSADGEGYPRWVRHGLLAGDGRLTLQIGLGEDAPRRSAQRQSMGESVWPPAEPEGRFTAERAPGRADSPPETITVGFADAGCSVPCCTGSCGFSCAMSLETYVRRGVGDEWIASWAADALAAGSVAYRSYGAWHVENPPAHGAYDICSSACCQVNEPDTHASTDLAAAETTGLMLVSDGGIFRSEYSAQNNCLLGTASCSNADLSCGDGFAGSPATGWPCLADPVGQGRECFGHGRGMSQWGNHYWTQADPARNWKWQLDHYYNDNGAGSGLRTATISRALAIESAQVPANAVAPGTVIGIDLAVRNLAAGEHSNVLIGASLRRAGDPFIDDPANDRPVAVPPGSANTYRSFAVPAEAPPGIYSVWIALWIDVDRNGVITSDDLSQDLLILSNALTVGDGGVFQDRFESIF